MTRAAARFSPAALTVSALVSAELIAARALLRADSARVWLGETPLRATCAIRDHLQVPCPGCGFSRGIVLALHGELTASFALFPAAPLLVLGAVALVGVLLALVAAEHYGADLRVVARRLRVGGMVYVAVLTLVWGAGYAARVSEPGPQLRAEGRAPSLTPPR